MAEGSFTLARGLQLDPDYIGGGTFALLAKKGWGKTYAMRVMAEEFAKTGVPFVALDPMDAFWGVRASKDGKGSGGLDIPIFGGEHGDVPLEPTAGKLMADLVVEEGLSMVLSIAHFGSRAAERRFALDFLGRLYRTNRDLVHLLIDEADLFAPQKPQAGDQKLLGETENIVRRGRNKGIGITLGTQRPAVLNKDVLTQVDGLIIGRMLGPNDRNAIDAWVGAHGDTKKGKAIKDELPDLATGQAYVWVPEQGVLKKVQIRASRTFDSSPTRKRTKSRRSLTLADVDLTGIASKVAASIEKAKQEDPRELRKQIAELRKELEKKPAAAPSAPAPDPIEVKVPVLDSEAMTSLRSLLEQVDGDVGKLPSLFEELLVGIQNALHIGVREQLDRAEEICGAQPVQTPPPTPDLPPSVPRRDYPNPGDLARKPPAAPVEADPDLSLGKAEKEILNVLVQFAPDSRTKTQIAVLTGRSQKSSGFRNALGKLRSNGLVVGSNPLTATEAGIAAIPNPAPLPRGEALLAHWLGKLGKAERDILDYLHRMTVPCSKEDIADATERSVKSSGFRNALGRLRTLELIEGSDPITASAELYG
jgi:hypothetical protein